MPAPSPDEMERQCVLVSRAMGMPLANPWLPIQEEAQLWRVYSSEQLKESQVSISPMMAVLLANGAPLEDAIGSLADIFRESRGDMQQVLEKIGYPLPGSRPRT